MMEKILAIFLTVLVAIGHATPIGDHDPDCPFPDPFFPVYYPYLYDCARYYRCSNGHKILEICPTGFLWDVHLDKCNTEFEVDCSQVVSTTTLPSTTTTRRTTTTAPTTTPITTTRRTTTTTPTTVPTTTTRRTTTTAPTTTPTTTTRRTTTPTTPATTPTTTTRRTTTTTPTTTPTTTTRTTAASTTSTPALTTPTSPASTTLSPDEINSLCTNQPEGTYLAYPGNKSKFIECSHHTAFVFSCPAATQWDQSLRTCC